MNVYITRAIPGPAETLLKEAGFDVEVSPHDRPLTKEELHSAVQGKDAVITLLNDTVDAAFFEAAGEQLKIVANYAVGYDNIDLDEAKTRGIATTHTPGALTDAVAEHTIALMLALTKRVCEAHAFTVAGKYKGWAPELLLGEQMKGKTLGVIGSGRIGYGVAKIAHDGLGMNIIYNDVQENEHFERDFDAPLKTKEELLKEADVVTLHVPLLEQTKHLIDTAALTMMKPTAYIINTARGPVIDESALVEALRNNMIKGAALDVFENEPKLSDGLAELPNVVLTPHIASATMEARAEMAEIAAKNVIAVLQGEDAPNQIQK